MHRVLFVFGKSAAHLRVREKVHFVPPCRVAVAVDPVLPPNGELGPDVATIGFHTADFAQFCCEIPEVIDSPGPLVFVPQPVRVIDATPSIIDTLRLLSHSAPYPFFRFVYAYCLALDRDYFSALARYAASGDRQFLQFMEANCLNAWPVERYAQELTLPLRKFNVLFQEKYGTSAKRWLMERRLAHACELLRTTPSRVLDIAFECGFSNHAHFTDTFRKRFLCNPTQYRLRHCQFSAARALEE